MEYRTIDPIHDREMIIAFRKDSYVVSFGHSSGFGDEDDYVTRISECVLRFPEGQVIARGRWTTNRAIRASNHKL